MLQKCLEDLEKRINPAAEEQLMAGWITFCDRKYAGDIFSPSRSYISPPSFEWPALSINESLKSYENIALYQLGACSQKLFFRMLFVSPGQDKYSRIQYPC